MLLDILFFCRNIAYLCLIFKDRSVFWQERVENKDVEIILTIFQLLLALDRPCHCRCVREFADIKCATDPYNTYDGRQ